MVAGVLCANVTCQEVRTLHVILALVSATVKTSQLPDSVAIVYLALVTCRRRTPLVAAKVYCSLLLHILWTTLLKNCGYMTLH